MNADGSNVRRVTNTPACALAINPVCSPSTDTLPSSASPGVSSGVIAFTSERDGDWETCLMLIKTDNEGNVDK